jgi:hypothetical protein
MAKLLQHAPDFSRPDRFSSLVLDLEQDLTQSLHGHILLPLATGLSPVLVDVWAMKQTTAASAVRTPARAEFDMQ